MHAQSCPTVCDSMDCSQLGSSVHGIFQARILEWVTISFPKGSFRPRYETCPSMSPELAGGYLTTELPGKPQMLLCYYDTFIQSWNFPSFWHAPISIYLGPNGLNCKTNKQTKSPFSLLSLATLGQISLNTFVCIESLWLFTTHLHFKLL